MMKSRILGIAKNIAVLGSVCLILVGCAAKQAKVSSEQYSGYLGDYSQLTKVEDQEALRWISDKVKTAGYKKLMLDPVVVYPQGASTPLLEQVTVYFDQAFLKAFGDSVEVVTAAGPGVVRIKPAITGVTSEAEGMKAYEAIPIAAIISGVKAAAGARSRVTQVFMEAEVVDSVSGERIAAVVRKGTGEQSSKAAMSLSDVSPILDTWASEGASLLKEYFK